MNLLQLSLKNFSLESLIQEIRMKKYSWSPDTFIILLISLKLKGLENFFVDKSCRKLNFLHFLSRKFFCQDVRLGEMDEKENLRS